jgi:hypothetical protein
MTIPDPGPANEFAPAPGTAGSRARALTDSEQAAVIAVGVAVCGFAGIGFVNSFAAVSKAAEPSFGGLAVTVPLGIDLGIAIFAALDIVLARLDMRPPWVRFVPWALTAATIYLNVAGQHAWFGRIAHAVFPALWVMAVEVGAHVIRVRAGLTAGTAIDKIRASRWLLAPVRTAGLWRRMVLWEIRSYPSALTRERDRVLARTELADTYGWRWRQTAPRRLRALYRLGELAPGSGSGPAPSPAPAPAAALPAAPAADGPAKADPPSGRKPGRTRPGLAITEAHSLHHVLSTDVAPLMPLGWRIAADLARRDVPLTRDSLAAALRDAGQPAGNARVGALLTRLRTEPPAGPPASAAPDPGPDPVLFPVLVSEGGTR